MQIVSIVQYILFSERRSSETGTFCTTHAVHETPAPLPAVIFGLGPPAPDQSAAVLLLLCRTWRVSDGAEAGLTAHFTLVTDRMQASCKSNKHFKTSQEKELQQIKAFFYCRIPSKFYKILESLLGLITCPQHTTLLR